MQLLIAAVVHLKTVNALINTFSFSNIIQHSVFACVCVFVCVKE